MVNQGALESTFDLLILALGKQPSRDFLRESLLFIIGVADGHIEDSLSEPFIFRIRMCLYQHGSPSFESNRSKSRDIRAVNESIFVLNKMMLAFDLAVEPRYR
jgi:hypothetical protein